MSPVSIPIYTPFGFFCLPVSTSNRTTQTGLSFPPVWPKETDIFVSLPLSLLCFKAGVILKFRSCNFVSRLENVLLFVCGISSRVSESTRMILCFWCICMRFVCLHTHVYTGLCAYLWRPEDNLKFCCPGSIYPVFLFAYFVFLYWDSIDHWPETVQIGQLVGQWASETCLSLPPQLWEFWLLCL